MVIGTDRMRGDEMGVDGPPGGALDSPGDEDLGGAGSDAAHTAHTTHSDHADHTAQCPVSRPGRGLFVFFFSVG